MYARVTLYVHCFCLEPALDIFPRTKDVMTNYRKEDTSSKEDTPSESEVDHDGTLSDEDSDVSNDNESNDSNHS